jgi:transposase
MAKIVLHLSDDERQELNRLVRSGKHPARKVRRAQILLRTAEGWTDDAIGAALGVSRQTVHEVRKQAATEGVDACLRRTSGRRPGQQAKALDGVAEAHLVALTCREPPAGHERWTLRLLAEQMVALEYVTAVSYETVRQALKKTSSNPGGRKSGASRPSTTRRS